MDATDRGIRVSARYCKAWRSGDTAAMIDCYSNELTLHYFGSSRFAGDHVGKEAVLEVLAEVSRLAPRKLLEIELVLSGPDSVALVVSEELETADGLKPIRRVFRYRVEAGRFAECWLYEENQDVVDAAWA